MPYSHSIKLKLSFQQACEKTREALISEGFGVISDLDIQTTLKEKLGQIIPPYRIFGACNPTLASKAIAAEPRIGLLLPCNVLIRETGHDEVEISFQDVEIMLKVVDSDSINSIGKEAAAKLNQAMKKLQMKN